MLSSRTSGDCRRRPGFSVSIRIMAKATGAATCHLLEPKPYPARLSLVIPVYNESAVIPVLRREVREFADQVPAETEIVVVNDGSTDGTLAEVANWAAEDRRVKVVHLSRNFGHQLAATAGLDYATGDAVVLICVIYAICVQLACLAVRLTAAAGEVAGGCEEVAGLPGESTRSIGELASSSAGLSDSSTGLSSSSAGISDSSAGISD